MSAPAPVFDVAVIGAGAVGSAIARELSRYALTVALVEAGSDVGVGTSKANTAIWHTGYDAKPGTLESRLLKRSYARMAEFMPAAGVPVELTGGLLIAWTPEQQAALPKLHARGLANGDDDISLVEREEFYRREPHLGPGALGGLFVPGEGILCTYTLPLAFATQAVLNGAVLRLNFAVTQITAGPDGTHSLASTAGDTLACRFIVNAAGLHGDFREDVFRREIGLDGGPGRQSILRDPFFPDGVHRREVAHVGEPDGRGEQAVAAGSRFGEQRVDRREHRARLRGRILAGGADLPREVDDAVMDHGLAHARAAMQAFDGHSSFSFDGNRQRA